MTTARFAFKTRPSLRLFFVDAGCAGVACGGDSAPAGGPGGGPPGGGPPPMPVEMVTLTAKPVEQVTEFVSTVKSRQSATIQPEVEGFLTRIAVRSGQPVSRGTVLFEIDSAPQQAALSSTQSMRALRESDVEFARQQVARNKTLLTAGAISQREVEQFEAQLRAAEAQLKALDDQIRQQRSQLSYYRVTAPIAGTVGDIPVNTGDRVTRSTVLDDGQRERRARGLHQRAGAAGAAAEARVAGPSRRRQRQGARDQPAHVHLAERRHVDAVGAGQGGAGRRPRAVPLRSVRPRAHRLDHRAGVDGAGDGGGAHQRAVLRVRRGEERPGRWSPGRSRCSSARSSATTTSCRAACRSANS